jgi:type VI secretion system protein ImpH
MRASQWQRHEDQSHLAEEDLLYDERVLARIDDLALLRYGGLLAQRHRSAVGLAGILADYFEMPVKVKQFQGQWLNFELGEQSRLGIEGANSTLGMDVVVGQRAWDVQAKIRVRLGPLDYWKFTEFLPDRAAIERRKAFFMLVHLVRFYIGQALDFDVQLVLKAKQVPTCRLKGNDDVGARLGWNTWILSRPFPADAEDVVLEGNDIVWMNGLPPQAPPH